jgi:hypothetical protein
MEARVFGSDAIPFWAAVAAAAAGLSSLFAAIYTALTFKLLQIQSEPKVILYVHHDHERPSLLSIVVENIGRGVAKEVSFVPSREIPASAWGLTLEDATPASIMKDGPLVSGIESLGPGTRRKITWGQYGGLMAAIGEGTIRIDYKYRSGKRWIHDEAILEVCSFTGTDASTSPATRVADSLSEIAKIGRQVERHVNQLIQGGGLNG